MQAVWPGIILMLARSGQVQKSGLGPAMNKNTLHQGTEGRAADPHHHVLV